MNRIIKRGEPVARLGSRRLGGYLALFDNSWHRFSPHTDFGQERKSVTLYFHGLDPSMKRTPVATGRLDVKSDAGVWIEAQLQKREEYEEKLLEMAERGELEWSSAADVRHVRTQKRPSGALDITRWPLGLEASASPAGAVPHLLTNEQRIQKPTKSAFEGGSPPGGSGDMFDQLREAQRTIHHIKKLL